MIFLPENKNRVTVATPRAAIAGRDSLEARGTLKTRPQTVKANPAASSRVSTRAASFKRLLGRKPKKSYHHVRNRAADDQRPSPQARFAHDHD